MGKIKRRTLLIAVVAILFVFMTEPTVAYYATIGTATNVVTSGDIELIIHEKTADGSAFPAEGVRVIPGDVVSKVVSIENSCTHPFYLRVKLVYGASDEALSPQDCLKLNINSHSWKLHDGWYYYTGILEPGQETPQVFSQVQIVGSQVSTGDIGKTLKLTVLAQAVQSENNPIQNGDTTTAAGWPAEQ